MAVRGRRQNGSERPHDRSEPQLEARSSERQSSGPNPFVVVGAMAAAGALVAKILDWRGHAHPRS
jgi:hypothetical protein